MSPLQAVWHASLRSILNALRFERRQRLAAVFALLLRSALVAWLLSYLIPTIAQWRALGNGALNSHLWLACCLAWAVVALVAVLATVIYGFNGDEALLLATQPLAPTTLLRVLYSLVLWRGVGTRLVFEVGIPGVALCLLSGWNSPLWLLLLVSGTAGVTWLSMLVTLLVMRSVWPHPGRALLGGFICALSLGLFVELSHYLHWDVIWTNSGQAGRASLLAALATTNPLLLICSVIGWLLFLLLAWFLLARRTGLLYLTVLQQQQGREGSSHAFVWPGLERLLALFGSWRTPVGALLFKGLLQQSRHLLAWLRLLLLIGLLLSFPLVRPMLATLHLSDVLQTLFYAAGIAFLTLLEYAPYAVGGEGARLTLYLVAPLNLAMFLRARLCSYLLPAFFTGGISTLVLSMWVGLNAFSCLLTLLLLSLILTGYVALTVLGSALDADLTQVAEDWAQVLILEEFPMTPRRLQLLGLTLLLFGGMLLLCWKLPPLAALLTLASLDAMLLGVGLYLGQKYLAHLSA